MFGSESCPRCLHQLSEERMHSTPKVCDACGHVLSKSEHMHEKSFNRQSLRWVVGSAVAIMLTFMYVVAWGGYSLEVLPMQITGMIGMQSPASQERMAQICLETKKLDCTESIYHSLAFADPRFLVRLGKFQFNRMKYAEAAATFQTYFAKSGDDMDARYVYARALSEAGNVDEAAQQFDIILAAKPDILQRTVAENYVKLLVQHNRFDQAHKVLESIRKRGDNVATFMESEFKNLSEKLGKSS